MQAVVSADRHHARLVPARQIDPSANELHVPLKSLIPKD
jgi:hypothetical protein